VLALDTRVYVAAALRLINAPILPLAPRRAAEALLGTCQDLERAAGGRVDLAPLVAAAGRLSERTRALAAVLDRLATEAPAPARLDAANEALRRLSRVLVPLAYTSGDRFTHDLALPLPPLAGLQPAAALDGLDPAADLFRFTVAALVRERNRAAYALEEAADLIDAFLATP
jgi:hypothetical protein